MPLPLALHRLHTNPHIHSLRLVLLARIVGIYHSTLKLAITAWALHPHPLAVSSLARTVQLLIMFNGDCPLSIVPHLPCPMQSTIQLVLQLLPLLHSTTLPPEQSRSNQPSRLGCTNHTSWLGCINHHTSRLRCTNLIR